MLPAPAPDGSLRYQAEIDLASDSTHARVIRLVGAGKRVLELGCSTGYMSRILHDRGCAVVGIEQDAAAGARARAYCERVILRDLEQLDLPRALGRDRFDVVVAADVLEHLKDPIRVLRALKPFLRDDGCVVASIPNVAHGSVRLALLGGAFQYTELGLLDRTHLRFFTRQSLEEMFEQAEYAIGHLERQMAPVGGTEVAHDPAAVPSDLLEKLSRDIEALTYQFIVVAYPMPKAGLRLVQRMLSGLAREKDDAVHGLGEIVSARDAAERGRQELAAQLEAARADLEAIRGELRAARETGERLEQQAREADQAIDSIREQLRRREAEDEVLRLSHQALVADKEQLESRLAAASGANEHLQDRLGEASEQLAERDVQIAVARERAEAEAAGLRAAVVAQEERRADLSRELELTRARMLGMQATKVWRLGTVYWGIERRIRSLFGP